MYVLKQKKTFSVILYVVDVKTESLFIVFIAIRAMCTL